ncbi:MAG: MazG family protein [Oscillospiraceae bacterium]
MIDFVELQKYEYADLLRIMQILRRPDGCPWDAVQTHASLRRNLLEEAYEVADAIDTGDTAALCEELGDLLLQVVFHAELEAEAGRFTMEDVVDGIAKKLVYRHPHVFLPDSQSDGSAEAWETLKRREKGQQSTADAVDGVARALPALWRGEKIQKKAAAFATDSPWDKLTAAVTALQSAATADERRTQLGALLLAATALAGESGIDPEEALHAACDAFAADLRESERTVFNTGEPVLGEIHLKSR